MATWRAEVFVNSRVGRITTEVEAASFSGAKDQIYAKHGDVQSITNLRKVGKGFSSSLEGLDGNEGLFFLAFFLFLVWIVLEYWWIAIPSIVLIGFLFYLGLKED